MRFTISAAVLAFAATAFAQTDGFDAMTAPAKNENVPAGKTYTIVWQPGTYTTGTVTLSLLGGASPETLQVLGTIGEDVQNSAGSYAWAVDSSLGDKATYGIQITYNLNTTVFQYSFPFHITASETTSASSSSSAGYPTGSASSSSVAVTTSYSATGTYSASTVAPVSSSFPTLAPTGNSTATATGTGSGGASTTLTSSTTKSGTSSTSSAATTSATTVGTNGAQRGVAGSPALALIGGFAAAAAFFL